MTDLQINLLELSDGKPIIIGIIGAEGAGKDTLADHLVSKYGFVKYSMAQPIKEIARIMFGWSDELLHGRSKDAVDPVTGIKPRDFYKWFGTDIAQHDMHSRFPDLSIPPREIWVHSMKAFVAKKIKSTQPNTRRIYISPESAPYYPVLRAIRNNPVRIIIPDIRFLHEARAIRELGGILIHLTTSSQAHCHSPAQYDIPNLIDPSTGWLHCTLNNPRVSIPDFHTRIDTWLSTVFNTIVATTEDTGYELVEEEPEENGPEYEDDLINTMTSLKTPAKEPEHEYTSNLSIYI